MSQREVVFGLADAFLSPPRASVELQLNSELLQFPPHSHPAGTRPAPLCAAVPAWLLLEEALCSQPLVSC